MARTGHAEITLTDISDGLTPSVTQIDGGVSITDPTTMVSTNVVSGTSPTVTQTAGGVSISDPATGLSYNINTAINNATARVFIRSNTEPTTSPTATGTYDFNTALVTFSGGATSNGWSNTIPAGSGDIWQRSASVATSASSVSVPTGDWGTAVRLGAEGSDGNPGLNSKPLFLFQRTSSFSRPAQPTQNGVYTFSTDTYSLASNNGWTIEIPNESQGGFLWLTQASIVTVDAAPTVNASAWQEARLLGSPGGTGSTGPRTVSGVVWFQSAQTNTPSSPTASSYNFNDGSLTNLSDEWSRTQPEFVSDNVELPAWQSIYTVRENSFGGSQTVTFNTPTSVRLYSTNIQSDNFVTGESGWQIQRDTGSAEFENAIIRGNSRVAAGNVGDRFLGIVTEEEFSNTERVNFAAGTSAVDMLSFTPTENITLIESEYATGFTLSLVQIQSGGSAVAASFDFTISLTQGSTSIPIGQISATRSGNDIDFTSEFEDIASRSIVEPFFGSTILIILVLDGEIDLVANQEVSIHSEIMATEDNSNTIVAGITEPSATFSNVFYYQSTATDTSLFSIGTGNADQMSASFFGGLGVTLGHRSIFRGSSSSVVIDDSVSRGSQLLVRISWSDSNHSTASTTTNNISQALIPVIIPHSVTLYPISAESYNFFGITGVSSFVQNVNNEVNDYICRVEAYKFRAGAARVRIDTDLAASNISNIQITDVLEVYHI